LRFYDVILQQLYQLIALVYIYLARVYHHIATWLSSYDRQTKHITSVNDIIWLHDGS